MLFKNKKNNSGVKGSAGVSQRITQNFLTTFFFMKKTGIIYDAGFANLHEENSSYQFDSRTPTV